MLVLLEKVNAGAGKPPMSVVDSAKVAAPIMATPASFAIGVGVATAGVAWAYQATYVF